MQNGFMEGILSNGDEITIMDNTIWVMRESKTYLDMLDLIEILTIMERP